MFKVMNPCFKDTIVPDHQENRCHAQSLDTKGLSIFSFLGKNSLGKLKALGPCPVEYDDGTNHFDEPPSMYF